MDNFLGEIRLFGFNFAPQGWATCDGQVLSISQNTALFSLLGTTYGGNGVTTFALPDLRGRLPMHQGQGPGLSSREIGEVSGQEAVTLTAAQLPAHNHQVISASSATSKVPVGNFPGPTGAGASYGDQAGGAMNAGMVTGGGSSQPHNNMPPFLVMNWCIALVGIFPSRN